MSERHQGPDQFHYPFEGGEHFLDMPTRHVDDERDASRAHVRILFYPHEGGITEIDS